MGVKKATMLMMMSTPKTILKSLTIFFVFLWNNISCYNTN